MSDDPTRSGEALSRRTERNLVLRLGAANLAGATVVFTYFTFLSSPLLGDTGAPTRAERLRVVVLFAVFVVVVALVGYRAIRQTFAPVRRWLGEGREPSHDEQLTVLLQPWLLTIRVFGFWIVGAVVFGVAEVLLVGQPVLEGVRVGFGALVGGLTSGALGFLLIERNLRPVFARALAGGTAPLPAALRVRAHLLVSWAVGSAIPLAIIALVPFGERAHDTGFSLVQVSTLAVIGLVSGGLIMLLAADGLSERLRVVRRALHRVEQGDIDVHVEVDEGGEIGMLQAGVNRMVEGLRERRRLEDLFGRHVGVEVARQAVEQGVRLGGERREASVLFVDLARSTELAATRPPEEVVEIVNALFGAVVAAVSAEQGWVDKFEGDGALCVFGAPTALADHADRALRAACGLRRRIDALARHEPALDVGIGVSSGTVVAGNIGSEERHEYTVIGDPVNEAARLTELAKTRAERVVASGRTIGAAADATGWVPVGEVELRGRTTPTLVYVPAEPAGVAPDTESARVPGFDDAWAKMEPPRRGA